LLLNPEQPQPQTQVIIAALNEEPGIGPTITELTQHLNTPRILVIDGNSIDRTVEVAKDRGAEVLFQTGTGKGDAIAKAIQHADPNTDYIVLTDADYTYPAEYLPEMIQILENNPQVGQVLGNRFNGNIDPKALHSQFYLGNKLLTLSHNLLNGTTLQDPLTGLRVIRTEAIKNWKPKSKGFDIEVELNSHIQKKGYQTIEIPIQYRQRLGQKKLKIKHGATILKRIILETTI
jgi:dolichol-phosphate mannosyltransferase